jgi:pantoate--beta-alanine ligase
MIVIRKVDELRKYSIDQRSKGKSVGLVPTMGYLHEGHISLITRATVECDVVIASLFVNPTQFAPHEDFDSYPRDFEHDYNLAKNADCDVLFAPAREEIYPEGATTSLSVGELAYVFEGKYRPHFFDGVATVVSKLFTAALPNKAFFGQKDYQQTLVVKTLSKDMLMGVEIVVCPIVRETNGLAMSSRNKYLTDDEKNKAKILFQSLVATKEFIESGERNRKKINAFMHDFLRKLDILKIDYALAADANNLSEPVEFDEETDIVLLLGTILGKTRLIDNMVVKVPSTNYNEDNRFQIGLK